MPTRSEWPPIRPVIPSTAAGRLRTIRPDRVGARPGVGDPAALADPPEQGTVGDAGRIEVAAHGRDRGSAKEPDRAVPHTRRRRKNWRRPFYSLSK